MNHFSTYSLSRYQSILGKIEKFFLEPASPRPIASLRIGLAGVLILQAFLLRNDVLSFFAHDGIVQGPLAEYLAESFSPRLNWLTDRLVGHGISEAAVIFWTTRTYFFALVLMLLGLFTRPVTVVVWFLQWTLMNSGYCSSYGFDMFAHIFLFYLIWLPAASAWSLDLYVGRVEGGASVLARLGIRVMQIHLAVSYLASAIEKSSGIQWWNGELLWRALSLPEYRQFDMSWIAHFPALAMAAGWGALAVEMFFCIFIWPKKTRPIWVALTASLHIGIGILLGLQIFAVIMCVFVISLFGLSSEPRAGEALSFGSLTSPRLSF